jgi:hypothetical protein
MQQPFDLNIGQVHYAVFPEGEDIFTIFKDGKEYMQIQKDAETAWLKLDPETAIPLFEPDEEVNLIGREILAYKDEEEEEEEGDNDEEESDDEDAR